MEKIRAIRKSPKWTSKYQIKIAEDKEKAVKMVEQSRADVKIYTDGSGYEGGIGAAARLEREGSETRSLKMHLGSSKEQTVYGGETAGLLLAAELLRTERRPFRSVFIGMDNQAAIQATRLRRPAPGHYLLDYFHKAMHRVRREQGQFQCTVVWTPGHCGITGNEVADVLAKEVAQGAASTMKRLPETLRATLPHSKAAVKMTYMKTLRRRAEKYWQQSPRYPCTTKIDDTLPSKWFLG